MCYPQESSITSSHLAQLEQTPSPVVSKSIMDDPDLPYKYSSISEEERVGRGQYDINEQVEAAYISE